MNLRRKLGKCDVAFITEQLHLVGFSQVKETPHPSPRLKQTTTKTTKAFNYSLITIIRLQYPLL